MTREQNTVLLQPNSVNIILLPHTLDACPYPFQLLMEICQALILEGYLVIFNLNAVSFLGLHKQFFDLPAFNKKIWSQIKIKQWLKPAQLINLFSKIFCLSGSHQHATNQTSLFCETLGQLCMPSIGNVYLIIAQKREQALMTMPEVWWKSQPLSYKSIFQPTPHTQ